MQGRRILEVICEPENEVCSVSDDYNMKVYDRIRTPGEVGTAVKDFLMEREAEDESSRQQ